MNKNSNNINPNLTEMTKLGDKAADRGYDHDFKVTEKGLESLTTHAVFQPEQIKVVNFYRDEGMSDPDDSSIMYVIETVDGEKGTLIDAYGTYSDPMISNFMKAVDEIHKKVNHTSGE